MIQNHVWEDYESLTTSGNRLSGHLKQSLLLRNMIKHNNNELFITDVKNNALFFCMILMDPSKLRKAVICQVFNRIPSLYCILITQLLRSSGRKSFSVMQSNGNSFCGDVVQDSFNKTSWDDKNILGQLYKSTYVCIFMILLLYNIS